MALWIFKKAFKEIKYDVWDIVHIILSFNIHMFFDLLNARELGEFRFKDNAKNFDRIVHLVM